MFFGCTVIADLYLSKEIVLLNSSFIFFKNLILTLIEKITTGTEDFDLFIWHVAVVPFC